MAEIGECIWQVEEERLTARPRRRARFFMTAADDVRDAMVKLENNIPNAVRVPEAPAPQEPSSFLHTVGTLNVGLSRSACLDKLA